jgi:hypothetical protein
MRMLEEEKMACEEKRDALHPAFVYCPRRRHVPEKNNGIEASFGEWEFPEKLTSKSQKPW